MALMRKTAYLAVTLALIVGLTPAPALAADISHTYWSDEGTGEFPLDIDADVAAPAPVVIKVEVPSSSSVVSVHIETSVIDGRFLGFTAGECHIKNLEESTVPISAAVCKVKDGMDNKAAALAYMDVTLASDRWVRLVEGENQHELLVERLAPGIQAPVAIDVKDLTGGTPIPDGDYATSVTIKVAAA